MYIPFSPKQPKGPKKWWNPVALVASRGTLGNSATPARKSPNERIIEMDGCNSSQFTAPPLLNHTVSSIIDNKIFLSSLRLNALLLWSDSRFQDQRNSAHILVVVAACGVQRPKGGGPFPSIFTAWANTLYSASLQSFSLFFYNSHHHNDNKNCHIGHSLYSKTAHGNAGYSQYIYRSTKSNFRRKVWHLAC